MATHNHPVQAGKVLLNLADTLKARLNEVEIIVVGSVEDDKPTGQGMPDFKFILSKETGGSKAFWLGIKEAQGEYIIWSCDDHEYHDPEWFEKYLAVRKEHPNINVFSFSSMFEYHGCVPIGSMKRDWYMNHYPEAVFGHYYWDVEIFDLAANENSLVMALGIRIRDKSRIHPTALSWQLDGEIYRRRKNDIFKRSAL